MSQTDETNRQVNLQRAQQDLQDIKELQKIDAFARYFLRRIRQKRQKVDDDFRTAVMSYEDREVHRKMLLMFDEILQFTGSDVAVIERQISDLINSGPPIPPEGSGNPTAPTSPMRPGMNANS